VSEELWIETGRLLLTAGIVTLITLASAAMIGWSLRKKAQFLSLPARPWRAPWGCFEVVVTVLVIEIVIPQIILESLVKSTVTGEPSQHVPPSEASAAVAGMPMAVNLEEEANQYAAILRMLWAGVIAFPLQMSIIIGVSRIVYPGWWRTPRPPVITQVFYALAASSFLTPLVLSINIIASIIIRWMEWHADAHALSKLAGRPLLDSTLFVIQACIAAPVIEEILFRGVILSWAIGARKPRPVADVPARVRPWLIVLMGLGLAALSGRNGAIAFSVLLVLGLPAVLAWFWRKQRTAGAVYSSAVLFGLIHSNVWPSPIPLFVFGLGLGWLAVRTRGVLAPIIAHSVLNTVSAIVVLSSPG
jgi:membrane protease YdiL (CAAX protease family)